MRDPTMTPMTREERTALRQIARWGPEEAARRYYLRSHWSTHVQALLDASARNAKIRSSESSESLRLAARDTLLREGIALLAKTPPSDPEQRRDPPIEPYPCYDPPEGPAPDTDTDTDKDNDPGRWYG